MRSVCIRGNLKVNLISEQSMKNSVLTLGFFCCAREESLCLLLFSSPFLQINTRNKVIHNISWSCNFTENVKIIKNIEKHCLLSYYLKFSITLIEWNNSKRVNFFKIILALLSCITISLFPDKFYGDGNISRINLTWPTLNCLSLINYYR